MGNKFSNDFVDHLREIDNNYQLTRIGDELEQIRDPKGFARRRTSFLPLAFMWIFPQMIFSFWFAWKVLGQPTPEQLNAGRGGSFFLTVFLTLVILYPLLYVLGKAHGKLLDALGGTGCIAGGFWTNYSLGCVWFIFWLIMYGSISGVVGMMSTS